MSSSRPQISVVIPLYNKRDTVARAVRSVLAQTVQYFEIVVVNDGSTDGSADVVRGFNDPRIRLIEQPNAGVSAARNRGIAEARHDLIAFLDADDEWLPEFLESVRELETRFPQSSVFATGYRFEAADGRRRLPIIRGVDGNRSLILEDYFGIAAQSDPPVCSSAVAVRKESLSAIGGFPVGVTAGEDLLTWARLAMRGLVALKAESLAIFHQDPTTAGGRPSRVPDPEDRVGKDLRALLPTATPKQRRSLRRYIGLWYKMRASIYLRLGCNRSAARECLKALGFRPAGIKLYLLLMACCFPAAFVRWVTAKRAGSRSNALPAI